MGGGVLFLHIAILAYCHAATCVLVACAVVFLSSWPVVLVSVACCLNLRRLLSRPFLSPLLTASSSPFISRLSQSMMPVGVTQLTVCNFQPLFAYGFPVLSSISPFVLNERPKGSG